MSDSRHTVMLKHSRRSGEPATDRVAGYSANVRLVLETPSGCFSLAQAGPDHVMLSQTDEMPAPQTAVLKMTADGEITSWPVRILPGGDPARGWVSIQRVGDPVAAPV